MVERNVDVSKWFDEEPIEPGDPAKAKAKSIAKAEAEEEAEDETLRHLKVLMVARKKIFKLETAYVREQLKHLTEQKKTQAKSKGAGIGGIMAGVAGGVTIAAALNRVARSSQALTKIGDTIVKLLSSLIDIFLAPFLPVILYFIMKIYEILRGLLPGGGTEQPSGVQAGKKMASFGIEDLGVDWPTLVGSIAGAILFGLAAAIAGASVGWIAVAAILGALITAWLIDASYKAGDAFMGWLRAYVIPLVLSGLDLVYQTIVGIFTSIYTAGAQVGQFFYNLGYSTMGWIRSALTNIGITISTIVTDWTSPIKSALDWITSIFTSFVESIKDPFQQLEDFLKPFTSIFGGSSTSNSTTNNTNYVQIASTGVSDLEKNVMSILRGVGTKFQL